MKEIPIDSGVRTCTGSVKLSKADMKLSKVLEVAFNSSGEAVENLRQINFQDNVVDIPADSSNLGVSVRIRSEF